MSNAPHEYDNYHTRRRDSNRPDAEGNDPRQSGQGSTHPYESYSFQDHRRHPYHHSPSTSIPLHAFDPPQQDYRLLSQDPVPGLCEPHPAAEDLQHRQSVVHLGDAYYSDYLPRDSGFGFQPNMTHYNGGSNDQPQSGHSGRMEEANVHPESSWELEEYEARHRATRQRSMYPNMVPSGQTLPSEYSSLHGRLDSSYNHAPPRLSSRSYGFAQEDVGYVAEDSFRRASYPEEYRGRDDFQTSTHRHGMQQTGLRNIQQQTHDGLRPSPNRVPHAEGQKQYDPNTRGEAQQNSWDFSTGLPADRNRHGMRGRHAGSPKPRGIKEVEGRHDHKSDLVDRYGDTPRAHEETPYRTRDQVSHADERETGPARQHPEKKRDVVLSFDELDSARKEMAMDFAVESWRKGEIDQVLVCGSPYLEQAARRLLEGIKAAEAKKAAAVAKSQWRVRPILKPARPSGGPFVEGDSEEDDNGDVTQSGTAVGPRNIDQDSITAVEALSPRPATPSSGAAQSKLLRDRARHDTPIRGTGDDSEMGSLFEGPNACNEEETLFVQDKTPVKQKSSDLGGMAGAQEDAGRGFRRDHSPDTAIVHDQSQEPSPASTVAPSSFSMMNREVMAKMMAERNRASEVIIPRPEIHELVNATQLPPLYEVGGSQERAISISSAQSDSTLSDSSSDEEEEEKKSGEYEEESAEERCHTEDVTKALEFINSCAPISTPAESTMVRNAESPPKTAFQTPGKPGTAAAARVGPSLKTAAARSSPPSGWQAATAIIQRLPAATNVTRPKPDSPAAPSTVTPRENGAPGEKGKKEESPKQESLESFGEDIMALRAEIARQKQQKREEEDAREQLALSESDDDEDEATGPQFDTGPRPALKRRGRLPTAKGRKTADRKPMKPVMPAMKKKAPAKQLSTEFVDTESDWSEPVKPVRQVKKKVSARQLSSEVVASESEESEPDEREDDQTQRTAVLSRDQKRAIQAHDGPISFHKLATMKKRKATEMASLQTKKRKPSPEQEEADERHGLPPLHSPIPSPVAETFLEKYAGNFDAMSDEAPTCAQVLAEEMDLDDTTEKATTSKCRSTKTRPADGGMKPPRLKRTTPPPKPLRTSNLRPSSRQGKPWPEAVHVPIEEDDEEDEPATKPAQRSPKTTRKGRRAATNAPSADTSPPQASDGIIMVNQNFTTPPSNRGAYSVQLCEADKDLVKWRNMGLKWLDVRTLYASKTNRIMTPQSLQYRYKRVLKENPDLAAAAVAKSDSAPPLDAAITASLEDEETEAAKPRPSGKTWNLDALEEWCANQRELEACLTDGEDESGGEPDKEDKTRNKQMVVRAPTPEPLDEGECWWQYQVWRKSWNKNTGKKNKLEKEKVVEKTAVGKDAENNVGEKSGEEQKDKEQDDEGKNVEEKRTPVPTTAAPMAPDAHAVKDSNSDSDSDSDTESESEGEEETPQEKEAEQEEDNEDEADPKALAEPYVAGCAYYHTKKAANRAAYFEIKGARHGIGGIGRSTAMGAFTFKKDTGPDGMVVYEAHFANGNVVRVWVDRFARAPGIPQPGERLLPDDPQLQPPDVGAAPQDCWLAQTVWLIKRRDVEVRVTKKRKSVVADTTGSVNDDDDVEGEEGMDIDEESRIVAVDNFATHTVLDRANREAAQLTLDHMCPPSRQKVEEIQARIKTRRHLDALVETCEKEEKPFVGDVEGDEEAVEAEGKDGERERGVVVTKRIDTTFWVERSILQGPRNV
ncbi:hypothetical protein IWX49DRAFT_636535 [Phyllosticta citricarpa]